MTIMTIAVIGLILTLKGEKSLTTDSALSPSECHRGGIERRWVHKWTWMPSTDEWFTSGRQCMF